MQSHGSIEQIVGSNKIVTKQLTTMADFYSQILDTYALLDIEDNSDEDDFLCSLVDEIESESIFTCNICGTTLKTERGLNRHKARHEEKKAQSSSKLLDVITWKQLIETSINKIVEEDLQCDSILEELKAFKLNDSDAEQCLPRFADVISNNVFDVEKFFPKFYKVVTQLDTICGLTKDCSTVVGFELANHVLADYKKSSPATTSISEDRDCDLSEREVAVVVYIAGYVFGQLYRRIRKSKLWESDLCQQKLALFKAGKIESVDSDDRYRLVKVS